MVLLAGQVADGLFTPIVGLGSDKIKTRIGNRMPWYIIGTLGTFPFFYFLIGSPGFITGPDVTKEQQTLFYTLAFVIYNFVWPSA